LKANFEARIEGVNLPANKRIEYGLTYVFGIGLTSAKGILNKLHIDLNKRVKDLSDQEVAQFHRDGVLLIKNFFSKEEIDLILNTAKDDKVLFSKSYGRKDGSGGISKMCVWNHPPDNLYGKVCSSKRVVDASEKLLGEEVYHYHSKIMLKEAKIGGKWEWHQDYGYWYNNGHLTPDMLSVFIALDKAHKDNGCLQVLRGSHKMGRVDHITTGEQAGADMERVNQALKRYELVYCEMEPGDTFFMHSNILHTSAANKSENPRWSLICCYNTKSNDGYKDSHHPHYTPLKKVSDKDILGSGAKGFEEKDPSFMNPNDDTSYVQKNSAEHNKKT